MVRPASPVSVAFFQLLIRSPSRTPLTFVDSQFGEAWLRHFTWCCAHQGSIYKPHSFFSSINVKGRKQECQMLRVPDVACCANLDTAPDYAQGLPSSVQFQGRLRISNAIEHELNAVAARCLLQQLGCGGFWALSNSVNHMLPTIERTCMHPRRHQRGRQTPPQARVRNLPQQRCRCSQLQRGHSFRSRRCCRLGQPPRLASWLAAVHRGVA